MAGLQPFLISTAAGALQREHAAWIDQRQTAQAQERELAYLGQQQSSEAAALRANQERDTRSAEASTDTQLAQLRQSTATDEQRRRDALRRTIAKQKAGMGARGVSSAGGSGEAILLGLVNDAALDRRDATDAARLKEKALQQPLETLYRSNLLEQSQLAERHRLQRLSRLV